MANAIWAISGHEQCSTSPAWPDDLCPDGWSAHSLLDLNIDLADCPESDSIRDFRYLDLGKGARRACPALVQLRHSRPANSNVGRQMARVAAVYRFGTAVRTGDQRPGGPEQPTME